MVWIWTGSVVASLFLTFFRELADTYSTVFLGASFMLPITVMDSIFHGAGAGAVAMILTVMYFTADAGFILLNLIWATGAPTGTFPPIESALVPFIMSLCLALVRIVLGVYILKLLAVIRLVSFAERCNMKERSL